MPTQRNPLYTGISDPYIAQGFANISDIFKPPSATDTLAYAKARETNEKLKRAADLYAYVNDPNFDQTRFDRLGVASGVWQPNQSYYSVDQGNQVLRDNNMANNVRALQQTQMEQSGQTMRALLDPVVAGATRFVPPSIASMFGVAPTQVGTVSAGQGETVFTPDGRTLAGAPKPLTESEIKARIIEGMPPELQQALVYGNTPVENVRTPGGVVPMTRPQQLAQGLPAIPDGQTQLANYRLPDGTSGTAAYDPITGGWVDSQTRNPLPQGATTFTAQLSGSKTDTGLGPTTANRTAATNQVAEVQRALDTLDLYESLIRQNPGAIGLPGLIRGTAQNAVATLDDLAKAFGKPAPQLQTAIADIRQGLEQVAPEYFDPSIPQADFYQGTLAYALARTENPSGEVSRQAFERALDRIKGGGALANTQSALAAVDAFRQQLQTQLNAVQTLNNPANARTDTSFQGPTDIPTISDPAEAAKLPRGTRFRTPDGREKVVP